MLESCKKLQQIKKKPLLVFFLILLVISSIVIAQQYTQDYNNPLTYSIANTIYCMIDKDCVLNALTVFNLSVIGQVFNVTMNLVTWNITESFNVGGNLQAKNVTADYFIGNGSLLTGIQTSSIENENYWNESDLESADFRTAGNVTAIYLKGNGSLLTNIGSSGIQNNTDINETKIYANLLKIYSDAVIGGGLNVSDDISITGPGDLKFSAITKIYFDTPYSYPVMYFADEEGFNWNSGEYETFISGSDIILLAPTVVRNSNPFTFYVQNSNYDNIFVVDTEGDSGVYILGDLNVTGNITGTFYGGLYGTWNGSVNYQPSLQNSSNITCISDTCYYNGTTGSFEEKYWNETDLESANYRTTGNVTANYHCFSDGSCVNLSNITKDIRTATVVVAANNSKNKEDADFICSGTNDDDCIENALNALPSSGGKVFLLDGVYTFGGELSFPMNNIHLEGSGESTYLTGTGEFFIEDKNFITISNIRTSIPFGLYSVTSGLGDITIYNNHIQGNIDVTHFGGNPDKVLILNNKIDGTIILGMVDDSIISGNTINGGGIDLDSNVRIQVINNKIINSSNMGIEVYADDSVFSGNTIINPKNDGILIGDADNTIISNNVIANSRCYGIRFFRSDGIIVSGNRVSDSNAIGGCWEIVIDALSNNNMILNNNLFDSNNNNTIKNLGVNTTIIGNFPGSASMEIQTAEGQEIKMIPEGTTTTILYPENTTFSVPIFGTNATIDKYCIGNSENCVTEWSESFANDTDMRVGKLNATQDITTPEITSNKYCNQQDKCFNFTYTRVETEAGVDIVEYMGFD